MLLNRHAERAALGRLLDAARAGQAGVLVVRGAPGIGKTALLENAVESAPEFRVVRTVGVESEMELAFAALHQLCAPMLDRLERLPAPQREALETAFGMSRGLAPDRFLIGLAVLGLLSEVAGERPLLCLVDDAQWLDRISAQVLGFVARRLLAEPVALVVAAREPGAEFGGLPELVVEGLRAGDARELLGSVAGGRLDERVQDRIVAETGGNPLALLELPRALTSGELAGGFGVLDTRGLPGRIEESFVRRLEALPTDTQQLLLVAAAEPAGEPVLMGGRRTCWGSAHTRRPRPRRPGCCGSASAWPSGTRWCGRRPTGLPPRTTAGPRTRRWRTQPTLAPTPTAVPGTAPRPPLNPMSRSPPNWTPRRATPKHAGAWPPQRRSSSGRPN